MAMEMVGRMGNGSDCQMSNDAAAIAILLLPAIVSKKERCALMAGRGEDLVVSALPPKMLFMSSSTGLLQYFSQLN